MSSEVGAGEALPLFSGIFGPVGIVGPAGAGPRPPGTNSLLRVWLWRSQSHGSPLVTLSRSVPETAFALPVATSAIHNSTALSLVFRNDRRVPSSEKRTFETFGWAGIVTLISRPSEIFLTVIP